MSMGPFRGTCLMCGHDHEAAHKRHEKLMADWLDDVKTLSAAACDCVTERRADGYEETRCGSQQMTKARRWAQELEKRFQRLPQDKQDEVRRILDAYNPAVFVNDGTERDWSHLNCPTCRGSGHIDDYTALELVAGDRGSVTAGPGGLGELNER